MKKLLSLLVTIILIATMAMPLMASADDEVIHLTYALWDDYDFNRALADYYHELHPNVVIDILELGGTDVYMANLYNMMAEGNFPDMYLVVGD